MGYERIGRPISYVAWSKPRADSRSDLIHRPGVGTSLGKAGVKASPETVSDRRRMTEARAISHQRLARPADDLRGEIRPS
jgi:hypothetical protein